MKKERICAALCLLLAFMLCSCSFNSGKGEPKPTAEEYLTPIVFAISTTYETSAWDDENPYERISPMFLWESVGWYAAYRYQTEGKQTLSEAEVLAFMRACGLSGELPETPDWYENADGLVVVTNDSYDFIQTKNRISDLFGVSMEFRTEFNDYGASVTLTTHIEDLPPSESVYTYSYSYSDGDEQTPYLITGQTLPSRPSFF